MPERMRMVIELKIAGELTTNHFEPVDRSRHRASGAAAAATNGIFLNHETHEIHEMERKFYREWTRSCAKFRLAKISVY
jgi:hypothetical protein